MISMELVGDYHEMYLISELNEIKNEEFRAYFQKKFELVEEICRVLKIDLPRMALSFQIQGGEVNGEALKCEDYEDLDRDTILINVDNRSEEEIDICIAHELRHLWQFKNNFKIDNYIGGIDDHEMWKTLNQEIDADAFALAYYRKYPHFNLSEELLVKKILKYELDSEAYKRRDEVAENIFNQI